MTKQICNSPQAGTVLHKVRRKCRATIIRPKILKFCAAYSRFEVLGPPRAAPLFAHVARKEQPTGIRLSRLRPSDNHLSNCDIQWYTPYPSLLRSSLVCDKKQLGCRARHRELYSLYISTGRAPVKNKKVTASRMLSSQHEINRSRSSTVSHRSRASPSDGLIILRSLRIEYPR